VHVKADGLFEVKSIFVVMAVLLDLISRDRRGEASQSLKSRYCSGPTLVFSPLNLVVVPILFSGGAEIQNISGKSDLIFWLPLIV